MIKANELRIGNWVKFEGEVNNFIDQVKCGCDIDILSVEWEPIPLTPEILESCGFESYDNPNHTQSIIYRLNSFRILEVFDSLKCREGIFSYYNGTPTYIKYLHQLQNLYFALTGQELEVKLPVTA